MTARTVDRHDLWHVNASTAGHPYQKATPAKEKKKKKNYSPNFNPGDTPDVPARLPSPQRSEGRRATVPVDIVTERAPRHPQVAFGVHREVGKSSSSLVGVYAGHRFLDKHHINDSRSLSLFFDLL